MNPKRRYTRDVSSPRPMKFRPQKVKFRRRYANSIVSTWTHRVIVTAKYGALIGLLLYSAMKTREIWTSSDWVRVTRIERTGDATPELVTALGLRPGLNIVTLKPSELEALAREKSPEFQNVTVTRLWGRVVSVDGKFRKSLVTFDGSAGHKGLDADGVVFTREANAPPLEGPIWVGETVGLDLRRIAAALSTLKERMPAFYKRVKFLKTDRIQPLRLILDNDVVVIWGDLEASSAVARASQLTDVLTHFEPKKMFASLRFVADDRVVMDAQWRAK